MHIDCNEPHFGTGLRTQDSHSEEEAGANDVWSGIARTTPWYREKARRRDNKGGKAQAARTQTLGNRRRNCSSTPRQDMQVTRSTRMLTFPVMLALSSNSVYSCRSRRIISRTTRSTSPCRL